MKKITLLLCMLLGITVSAPVSAAEAVTTAESSTSSIASYGTNYLIKDDGSLWVWGGNRSVPTLVPGLNEVEASFESPAGTFVVTKDHSVWKLETSTASLALTATRVEELMDLTGLFTVGNRIVAVNGNGAVFSSVQSSDGRTSSPFRIDSGIDNVAAVDGYSEGNSQSYWTRYLILKNDGTVWTSRDEFTNFELVQNLTDVIQLQKNYALKKDGTVWTWPIQNIYEPETISDPNVIPAAPMSSLSNIQSIRNNGYTRLAIDKQSGLWFWGSTITGWSDGTTYTNQVVPVHFSGIKNVTDAYIVERSIVALTSEGNVYTTSIDRNSMSADTQFTLLASGMNSIKGGGRYIIMQKADGSLWGWGVNKNAQLGVATYDFSYDKPIPMQKPISVSLNGEIVAFTNGVITRNEQNFVPLRSLFGKLGAAVAYTEDIRMGQTNKAGETRYTVDKKVTITRTAADKPALSITINTVTGATTVNNKSVTLATAPFVVNGTLYLPLRFISEQLGAAVEWLPQNEQIAISMN